MDIEAVIELVRRANAAPAESSRDVAVEGLDAIRQLRGWCDSIEVALGRVLTETASFPEQAMARPLRSTVKRANRVLRRAKVLDQTPALARSLSQGSISGEHVDAVGAALRSIEPEHRPALAERANSFVGLAEQSTVDELRDHLASAARELRTDGGTSRLDQQRRDARVRTWVSKGTGMYHLHARLDPKTGLVLDEQLRAMVSAKFADTVPSEAPSDPLERQDYLRAQAFIELISQGGGKVNVDIVPVVDVTNPRSDGTPTIDWGLPIELPDDVIRQWWPTARVTPVVLNGGAIVYAPGELNLGRSTRLANKAQRRALRARHRCCAVPGCSVRFNLCRIHHVIWWRNGGRTDLENLIPVCTQHHGQIHAGELEVVVLPDRSVIATHTGRTRAPPGEAAA